MVRRARPPSSRVAVGGTGWLVSPTLERASVVIALAVLAGLAGWVIFGSLQQDLASYVTAGRARALGLDPYLNHLAMPGGPWDGVAVYRHSRFLYPPLLAEVFRPLAALPYVWAKTLFTLASAGGLGLGLWLTAGRPAGNPRFGLALLAAAVWPPVFVALERGQIDLLLLPVLALAWRRRDQLFVAGAALAVGALGKPLVLLGWPVLLCAGRWRLVAVATGLLALLMGLGVIASGPALAREYLTQVLPRALLYGEGGPEAWLLPDESLARAGEGLAEGTARLDAGGRAFPSEIGTFRRNASVVRFLAGDENPGGPTGLFVLAALGGLLAAGARRRPDDPGWFWGSLLAGVAAAPVAWAMSLPLGLPLFFPLRGGGELGRPPAAAALAIAYGAGLVGPLVPGAWCVAAVAGAMAGALGARRGEVRVQP